MLHERAENASEVHVHKERLERDAKRQERMSTFVQEVFYTPLGWIVPLTFVQRRGILSL